MVDNHNQLLGFGFFSTNSQITCRVFEFTNEEIVIDSTFWKNKIFQAYQLRKQLIDFTSTNIFRLLHAEGDFFPGVIIDVYASVAVVQILIKGTENIKQYIDSPEINGLLIGSASLDAENFLNIIHQV